MLGFPILYCQGMRPMMFQLSGFCYRSYKDPRWFYPKYNPTDHRLTRHPSKSL